jgi:hemoglobin
MHRLLPLLFALLIAPVQAQDALQAFGGRPGLEAVMQDFFTRLQADARIGRFFAKLERDHFVQALADQACEQLGGPCHYRGASMEDLHQGLGIRKADFNALVEVLQDAMDARGVPFAAQNQLLARFAPMHKDILELQR